METLSQPFDVHVASRSFGGLPVCGDLPVAQPFANDDALVLVARYEPAPS